MASLRRAEDRRRTKPWQAKRRRGAAHYHLGYFRTREEALAAEWDFDKYWPRRSA